VLALTLVEKLVHWIEPVFATAGYFIIAGAVLAERSIFIGLIVPGDLILALGGVYASQGKMNVVGVIVIGMVAATAGESIGYWLGRRHGMGLIRKLPLVNRLEKPLDNAKEYFDRHGGKTVAIGRYATAAGAFIPFTAGVARMPYRRFIMFDAPAIAVWAIGITLFGYVFGRNLEFVDKVLSRFGYIMLGVVVGFIVGRIVWKKLRARSKQSAK
jgi:membrane-associated protein